MRIAPLLFVLLVFPVLLQSGSPNQTYTTFTTVVVYSVTQSSVNSIGETTLSQLTTSAYGVSTGSIPASYTSPATGQQICYYVPYQFHIDESVAKVVGTVSGSSPFNFYIMSQAQYDNFIAQNPPCGSSYSAMTLDYLRSAFTINFAPGPGDYYVLLENISSYPITYTIQLSAIENYSTAIYSTMQLVQLETSTVPYSFPITVQSVATTEGSSTSNSAIPISIVIVVILVAALAVLSWSRRRRRKEERTRVY